MSNQIVISSGAKVRNLNGVLTGTSGVVDALGINVPDGIPQLDGSGKILVSQLPNSVMEYKGSWNAATNTPTLANGTGNAGDVYLCEVAGIVNFGAGPIEFFVGDQVVYSGSIWQRASGATGTVSSVAVTESGDALTITGSPITTSGTINIGFAGTSGQYVNGAGGLTTFPSLTGYVPYTGATADVDLGTYGLIGDYARFNTAPSSVPTTLGTLSWDTTYRTLQLIDGDGDTTLQIGQEQRALIHNNTGATLTDGQVVYVTGSTGNLPSVALASNTTEASSSVTFGVVTESIAHGADGFVTISGNVNGLNTLAFNEGDALYLGSTAGTFTNVKPTAPANLVLIGYMIKKSGGNGIIFVKIQNGYELEELHDVSVTSVANNDGLFWDSATSLWKNKTIAGALGYTPANDSLVVHLAGTETISGVKTFSNGLQLASAGSGNQSSLFVNISSIFSASAGSNRFGFNNSNNIYFNKGINNGGILSWNNTSYRTYNLPDADGTLALTSDISGYVPYTGATSAVNLGSYGLTAFTLNTTSTIESGNYIQVNTNGSILLSNTGGSVYNTGYTTLQGRTAGFSVIQGTGVENYFTLPASTGYTYTFPATTGTVALTSNLASYLPLSGGTLTGALSGTSATFSGNLTINTNKFFVNATSGNVGIGTITPGYKLDVSSNSMFRGWSSMRKGVPFSWNNIEGAYVESGYAFAINQETADGRLAFYTAPSGTAGSTASFSERMAITNSGNVGIGTSSPSNFLTINDSAGSRTDSQSFTAAGNSTKGHIGQFNNKLYISSNWYYNGSQNADSTSFGQANIVFDTQNASGGTNLNFGTSEIGATVPTERMRITSGGNLLVGTTSSSPTDTDSFFFNVSGKAIVINHTTGTGSGNQYIGFAYAGGYIGSIAQSGTTGISYNTSSDYRLKQDLKDYNGLSLISAIKTYDYQWIADETRAFGVLAHELAEVIPYAVQGKKDGEEMQGVDYSKLVPVLVKAIQEQQAQIEELKALIAAK